MNQYMAIALSAGIPFLAILLGMFFNNQRFNALEKAMDKRFEAIERRLDKIEARFDAIDAELRYFHGAHSKLEGRVEEISRKQK